MNLSEILKDWPKKKYVPHYDMHKIMNNIYFNKALESCDYEIDREALKEALLGFCNDGYVAENSTEKFISTIPTWLKRIER